MADEHAFLRVIGANPDDDGPRLLYADFLEEKGDAASVAHAEFIRVQCALNAAGRSDPNLDLLKTRERDLLTEHWRSWFRPACQALGEPLPDGPRGRAGVPRYSLRWIDSTGRLGHRVDQTGGAEMPYLITAQFRRGFLSHVALLSKSYRGERHVARLWDRAPIDGLTLMGYESPQFTKTMAAIEGGERLRSLEMGFTDDKSVKWIAGHPPFGSLRELILKGIQGREDVVDVLSQSSTLTGLRVLILEFCMTDDEGIARLCRAPFAAGLERLGLVNCQLTNASANHLAHYWPTTCRLSYLDLGDNRLSGAGLRAVHDRFGDSLKSSSDDRSWPTRFYL